MKAHSHPPFDIFTNIMNFSTGELTFYSHRKNQDTNRSRLKVLATLKENLPLSLLVRKLR
jgi:hypothetical protein